MQVSAPTMCHEIIDVPFNKLTTTHEKPDHMNASNQRTTAFFLGLLLIPTISICVAQMPNGYIPGVPNTPPLPTTNPRPYLGSTGSHGPPLSTALPTHGPFSKGLTTTSPHPISTAPSTSMLPPRRNFPQKIDYKPDNGFLPNVSGQGIARAYMYGALYRGAFNY